MVERALLQHLAVDEDGTIQTHRPIVFYETDGTTPYAGVFYDQASGGAPVTSFETSHLGVVEAYTPLATRKSASVEVAGTLSPVKSGFFPRTEDIIVQEQSTLADLRAGLAVSQNAAAVYGLSVTQQHANNLIQRWVAADGSNPFIMTQTGLFNNSVAANGPGIGIGASVNGHRIAATTVLTNAGLAATGLSAFKAMEIILDTEETTGGDSSVASFFLRQYVPTANSGGRAVEAQASRGLGAGRAGGFCAVEAGIHTMMTAGTSSATENLGIYVHSNTAQFLGNGGAPVPADAGILLDSAYDGFWDYIRARARAALGTGIVFRVAGGVQAGDQNGDVVSAGRWRGSNGTALLPAVVGTDPDSGIFFGSDQVSISTNQFERLRVASNGVLDFRDLTNQVVALGGGALAALGATGGSGPTISNQGAWLKILVAGSARFLPMWS